MRRALVALTLVLCGVAAVACQPASKATITAKAQMTKPGCKSDSYISGAVKPAGATPRVWLQRTEGGKWVDWKWHTGSSGGRVRYLYGNVQDDGAYRIQYSVPSTEGVTYHLRVRSEGGGAFSNGVYITPTDYLPGFCT